MKADRATNQPARESSVSAASALVLCHLENATPVVGRTSLRVAALDSHSAFCADSRIAAGRNSV
jgi:hypothetical protein